MSISPRHRQTWLAAIFYTLLAVIFTWPLAAQLNQKIVGWPGDNFYFAWLVGWVQKALAQHASPLVVPQLNYPEGWNLAYNEITPAMVSLALPGSWLVGPVLGYNTSLLFSFILSGLGVFWWINRWTGNFTAGLLAGTAFAFAPYRMAHLLGHLNLMGTQWLPLYFMTFTDLLQARRFSVRTLSLPVIFLGLIAATSQYYLYMTLLLSLIFALGYLLLVNRKQFRKRLLWQNLGLFFTLALLITLLMTWPYVQLAQQNHLPPRLFEEVSLWSASPTDFITPSVQHFAWGDWIKQQVDRQSWVEKDIYIGAVTLALAFYALLKQQGGDRRLTLLLGGMGLISFILALGTNLHWLGKPVTVQTPAFLSAWQSAATTIIPLPGYVLFKLLPFYSLMRVWMRYAIFVQLFASLLAGAGLATLSTSQLFQRLKNHRVGGRALPTLVCTGILVLLFLDLFPAGLPFSDVSARPVELWLAHQSGQEAVAYFPFWQNTLPQNTYYTLVHHKPFIGAFLAANPTPQFSRIQPTLDQFPDAASLHLLRDLKIGWIIVDLTQYPKPDLVTAQIEALGLVKVFQAENQAVYQLK